MDVYTICLIVYRPSGREPHCIPKSSLIYHWFNKRESPWVSPKNCLSGYQKYVWLHHIMTINEDKFGRLRYFIISGRSLACWQFFLNICLFKCTPLYGFFLCIVMLSNDFYYSLLYLIWFTVLWIFLSEIIFLIWKK